MRKSILTTTSVSPPGPNSSSTTPVAANMAAAAAATMANTRPPISAVINSTNSSSQHHSRSNLKQFQQQQLQQQPTVTNNVESRSQTQPLLSSSPVVEVVVRNKRPSIVATTTNTTSTSAANTGGTSQCDSPSGSSASHYAKQSFSSSNPSGTINYIRRNKLRIQQQQQSFRRPGRSATPGSVGTSSQHLQHQQTNKVSSSSSSSNNRPSLQSTTSKLSSTNGSTTTKSIYTNTNLMTKSSLSSSSTLSSSSSTSRPVVTKVNAPDWINATSVNPTKATHVMIKRKSNSVNVSSASSPCSSIVHHHPHPHHQSVISPTTTTTTSSVCGKNGVSHLSSKSTQGKETAAAAFLLRTEDNINNINNNKLSYTAAKLNANSNSSHTAQRQKQSNSPKVSSSSSSSSSKVHTSSSSDDNDTTATTTTITVNNVAHQMLPTQLCHKAIITESKQTNGVHGDTTNGNSNENSRQCTNNYGQVDSSLSSSSSSSPPLDKKFSSYQATTIEVNPNGPMIGVEKSKCSTNVVGTLEPKTQMMNHNNVTISEFDNINGDHHTAAGDDYDMVGQSEMKCVNTKVDTNGSHTTVSTGNISHKNSVCGSSNGGNSSDKTTTKECDTKHKFLSKSGSSSSTTSRSSSNGPMMRKNVATMNLLNIIERSPPELIFLLDKSAKLSYNLCQFEQKLDHLERMFARSKVENVIRQVRKWVHNVRSKNIFLKHATQSGVTTNKTHNSDHHRLSNSVMNTKRKSTSSDCTPVKVMNPRSSEDVSTTATSHNVSQEVTLQSASISTEDELMNLLDRIASFTSSIIAKRTSELNQQQHNISQSNRQFTGGGGSADGSSKQSLSDDQSESTTIAVANKLDAIVRSNTLNSDDSRTFSSETENDGKVHCSNNNNNDEWLQSLPENIKEIIDQLMCEYGSKESGCSVVNGEKNLPNRATTTTTTNNLQCFYALKPELLRALLDNVKTSVRLVQVQRHLDRLLCAQMKQYGQLTSTATATGGGGGSGGSGQSHMSPQRNNMRHASPTQQQQHGHGAKSYSCPQFSLNQFFQSNQQQQHESTSQQSSKINVTRTQKCNNNTKHHQCLRYLGTNTNTNSSSSSSNKQSKVHCTTTTNNNNNSVVSHGLKNVKECAAAHHLHASGADSTESAGGCGGNNCCCCIAMVSDGDSGGEFTATTITNEFNNHDDELSSLLNQIAVCSQKIVEQTGSASSNSTISSGCCCSSIDAKCNTVGAGSLSPNLLLQNHSHSHHHTHGYGSKQSSSPQIIETPSVPASTAACYHRTAGVTAAVQQQHPQQINRNMQYLPCYHSCTHLPPLSTICEPLPPMCKLRNTTTNGSMQHTHSYLTDGHHHHHRHHHNRKSFNQAPASSIGWPTHHNSFDENYANHNRVKSSSNHIVVESLHETNGDCNCGQQQQQQPQHTQTLSGQSGVVANTPGVNTYSDWPLDESFADCLGSNVTGFMLANTGIDMFATTGNGAKRSKTNYPTTIAATPKGGYYGNVLDGSSNYPETTVSLADQFHISNTNAFILDSTVDVESFLNEMEKELEDNHYTSAPPFMSRANCDPHCNNNMYPKITQHEFNDSCSFYPQTTTTPPERSCVAKSSTGGTGMICNHHPMLHRPRKTGIINTSSNAATLVKGTDYSSATIGMPMYASTSQILNKKPDHNTPTTTTANRQGKSSLLVGDNWRLSQRHSIMNLDTATTVQHNSHFPFPAMASMPLGSSVLAPNRESYSYKRLIVPSVSRDLLDKFRTQLINQVNEETDNQLREIDQWLEVHMPATSLVEPPDVDDSTQHDTECKIGFSSVRF